MPTPFVARSAPSFTRTRSSYSNSDCVTYSLPYRSIRYTSRDSLCAVAVIAPRPPSRLLIRRWNAPNAVAVRPTACAAIRNACATRFLPFRGFDADRTGLLCRAAVLTMRPQGERRGFDGAGGRAIRPGRDRAGVNTIAIVAKSGVSGPRVAMTTGRREGCSSSIVGFDRGRPSHARPGRSAEDSVGPRDNRRRKRTGSR